MFAGFLTILQFLWPFFKEALFGNGTFKVWFRKNYMTVLWFVMMVIMLLMVLALTNILKNAESDLALNSQSLAKYKQADTTNRATITSLKSDNDKLRAEVARLKKPPRVPSPTHPAPSTTVYVTPPASHAANHADENDDILRHLRSH